MVQRNVSDITSKAKGQWRPILEGYGCQLPSSRHHGPCPVCGGKDRFRFDDKDGRGTWFCNQCGAGDGLNLVAKFTGKSLKHAANDVAAILGLTGNKATATQAPTVQASQENESAHEIRKAGLAAELADRMTRESLSVSCENIPYLASKGFKGFAVKVLRENYLHALPRYKGIYRYLEGTLLVPLMDVTGFIHTAELISKSGKYAIAGGRKKECFALIEPKQGDWQESKIVAIAEGYATGLSVRELSSNNLTVFCGMSKNGLMGAALAAQILFPDAEIVITGDNSAHRESEAAAAAVNGRCSFPPAQYDDWDDYRQAKAWEAR